MEHTAKNFTLQLGSLISLFISIPALIALLFSVITIAFPDATDDYWVYEGASTTIRSTIAFLIVFFPTYLVMTRMVNTARRRTEESYLKFTQWLIYVALLIGGLVLLGDLVAVINGFLSGELTVRFILKALTVLLVVGAGFVYYLLDARQYWRLHERHSVYYAAGISLAVFSALVLGFMHTETPDVVREMRIDTQQVADLQLIQSHIVNYYNLNGTLPATLDEASAGLTLPVASEGRPAYTYSVSATGFELCAEFAYPTPESEQYASPTYYGDTTELTLKNLDNWNHQAGAWCFKRILSTPVETVVPKK